MAHTVIRPNRIGGTGSIKNDGGSSYNGFYKIVLSDNEENKVVIELDETIVKRVFEICLIAMKYSDIEYLDIVENITNMDVGKWQ